ncbi:MAG: hypothetical protein IKC37_00440 [Clostridia bacterium]|nr:hypothetical protein [Clostridia bacterium]
MLKLLLGLAIIAFFTFLVYFFTKKYRRRKNFFCQFSQFNERFLAEVSYTKRPLPKFLTAYAYKGEFESLLRTFYQSLTEESAGGRRTFFLEGNEFSFLTKEQINFVRDYFQALGRGDSNAQKGYFGSVKSQLAALKEKSEIDAKKYGDLYLKLGLLAGLAALILIV